MYLIKFKSLWALPHSKRYTEIPWKLENILVGKDSQRDINKVHPGWPNHITINTLEGFLILMPWQDLTCFACTYIHFKISRVPQLYEFLDTNILIPFFCVSTKLKISAWNTSFFRCASKYDPKNYTFHQNRYFRLHVCLFLWYTSVMSHFIISSLS